MTQLQYETDLTPAQRDALLKVYARRELFLPNGDHTGQRITWEMFVERAHPNPIMRCVMVPWSGMWLGIEPDGHTHS